MFTCRKLKLKAVTLYMSNLPTFPMDHQSPPFTNTGLDFFGPMFIKQQLSRLKRWGCLFACMVTQAVHLELVESLDRLIYKCPADSSKEEANPIHWCQIVDPISKGNPGIEFWTSKIESG